MSSNPAQSKIPSTMPMQPNSSQAPGTAQPNPSKAPGSAQTNPSQAPATTQQSQAPGTAQPTVLTQVSENIKARSEALTKLEAQLVEIKSQIVLEKAKQEATVAANSEISDLEIAIARDTEDITKKQEKIAEITKRLAEEKTRLQNLKSQIPPVPLAPSAPTAPLKGGKYHQKYLKYKQKYTSLKST